MTREEVLARIMKVFGPNTVVTKPTQQRILNLIADVLDSLESVDGIYGADWSAPELDRTLSLVVPEYKIVEQLWELVPERKSK